jgi:hypothetical protein
MKKKHENLNHSETLWGALKVGDPEHQSLGVSQSALGALALWEL